MSEEQCGDGSISKFQSRGEERGLCCYYCKRLFVELKLLYNRLYRISNVCAKCGKGLDSAKCLYYLLDYYATDEYKRAERIGVHRAGTLQAIEFLKIV